MPTSLHNFSDKPIVLIGLMGAGKSSIGRKLATKLALPFWDSDDEIETISNYSISEIFALYGEARFRKLEEIVIERLISGPQHVLATGGGAFMNKELRKIIKQKSKTFWLYWNADTLIKRIKNNDKRPVVKNMSLVEIKKLISERNKIYYFSDFKIICESLKKAEIADKIFQKCKKNEIIY